VSSFKIKKIKLAGADGDDEDEELRKDNGHKDNDTKGASEDLETNRETSPTSATLSRSAPTILPELLHFSFPALRPGRANRENRTKLRRQEGINHGGTIRSNLSERLGEVDCFSHKLLGECYVHHMAACELRSSYTK
jgi:hypothetical protein